MTHSLGYSTLVVAQDFPWPATIGSHLRLGQVIEAASAIGEVDLFSLVPARRTEPCRVPDRARVGRSEISVRPAPDDSAARRALWALRSRLPFELEGAVAAGAERVLRSWAHGRYDVVWFSKAATFESLGRPDLGPTVVDLDDLEDAKILARLELARRDHRFGPGLSVRALGAQLQGRLNAARWGRLQRSVASAVGRVVLCSELDSARSGLENCVVVPNAYPEPEERLGRIQVRTPPTLLFAGSFCYGPNADAVRWFVSRVWPRIRAERDDATLRLVGELDRSTPGLAAEAGVEVTGEVESMAPELARADVVIVPIRYGSGTRVKILEAFAHGIPVVSTATGAEGLGVEPGAHLLVENDEETFALACVQLLSDTSLREHVTSEARRLYAERFSGTVVTECVRRLIEDIAGTRSPGSSARTMAR